MKLSFCVCCYAFDKSGYHVDFKSSEELSKHRASLSFYVRVEDEKLVTTAINYGVVLYPEREAAVKAAITTFELGLKDIWFSEEKDHGA